MIIRPVQPEDGVSFQNIMKASISGICREAYGPEATAAWVSDDNPAFHFRIPQFAFVAEEAGEIIAVGGWSLTDVVDLHPVGDREVAHPTHARVNAVYVAPGWEGQGVGHHMMNHLEQDILDHGVVRDVYLWSTKNAIPFYLSHDYAPGKDEHPEVAPGYTIQIRFMWKRLG